MSLSRQLGELEFLDDEVDHCNPGICFSLALLPCTFEFDFALVSCFYSEFLLPYPNYLNVLIERNMSLL